MGTKGSRFFVCCILLLSISLQAGHTSSVRLVGGNDTSEGRLEIFHDGIWGTVCDDDWGTPGAEVVCNQLGFSGVKDGGVLVNFGPGTGPIWLDDLVCSGLETQLSECQFPGWGINNCQHVEDVGIRCQQESLGAGTQAKYALPHSAAWSERLGELFDSGSNGDVKISVVEDGRPMEPVWAHVFILHLNPKVRDSQTPLSIHTTSHCSRHARAFIRYFYTGEVSLHHTACICILRMASDWGLTEFQNETANMVASMLSKDYTFEVSLSVYEYALSPLNQVLMDILLRYLAWNFERLVQTPAWTNLPSGLVKDLLARSDLVVSKETVVLQSLEKWAAAQGTTAVPQELLQLIRFPMIPTGDFYLLRDPQDHVGEWVQFQVMPCSSNWTETNSSRPRIYTDSPWSYSINRFVIASLRNQKSPSQGSVMRAFDFHTPFHSSALFTYSKANWKLSLNFSSAECRDTPAPTVADLNFVLNLTMAGEDTGDQQYIHFSNKLIVECAGKSTVRVDDFVDEVDGDFVYQPGRAGVAFPCHFSLLSYKAVIRSECRPGSKRQH